MRTAQAVLEVIRERGRRGLPLEDVYRQLFNPALYLLAYGKIGRNRGALTPGATAETADGMAMTTITAIIEALRFERYRWTPARRIYIEKRNSTKKRPLGLPTWSDKLLQEVLRLILEAYYEPQFSDHSHGFRPNRGCHTALTKIHRTWRGTTWFIEGDISACFDSLDHGVMLSILKENIHDNRFLRLLENLFKAGYLEEWRYHKTLSGSPQGGVVSPILSNIYLDRLDQHVRDVLIPAHTRGEDRRRNPAYARVHAQMTRLRTQPGQHQRLARLRKQLMTLPSRDPHDPEYRRLRYIRYADDILLGFIGPKAEAEAIKQQLGAFLRDTLKLELSPVKTLITHGKTGAARFLGYDISTAPATATRSRNGHRITGVVTLRVPVEVVRNRCRCYMRHGKPDRLAMREHDAVFSIVRQYAQEYRGLVDYYRPAMNLRRFSELEQVMETSLTKTLAAKLRISVATVYRRFHATYQPEQGPPRTVLQVTVNRPGKSPLVAMWGHTDLVREVKAVLNDTPGVVWNTRTEIVQRLLAETCELCGSTEAVQVHHIRALRDLHRPGRADKSAWVQQMATRQRKTLVVCHGCHSGIHAGDPLRRRRTYAAGEPGTRKPVRPVRRGADGKVPAPAG